MSHFVRSVKKMGKPRLVAFVAFAVWLGLFGITAQPGHSGSFYEGKTIKLLVALGVGGGTDIYARLVGRHWGKYIPGKPRVLVQNMPGGGGGLAFSFLHFRAEADGLTIGVASQGVPMRRLLRLPGHNYELTKMPLIAASSSGTVHFVSSRLGVESLPDLLKLKRKIKVGDTHKGSTIALAADLIFDLLQINIQHIFGYGSYGEVRLAVLRGEVDAGGGDGSGYNSSILPLEKKGDIKVLFQSGLLDPRGQIVRDPLVPDVQSVKEVYRKFFGKAPSGEKWEAVKGVAAVQTLGKSFWAPPGTPRERLRDLEEGYRRMVQSAEYQRDAKKILGIEDQAFIGKEAETARDTFLGLPQTVINIYRQFSK